MTPLARLDSWWMAEGSAAVLASLRIAIGGFALAYLLIRLPSFRSSAAFRDEQFEPVGLFRLADQPLPALAWDLLLATAVVAGIFFVLGFRFRLSGPLFALTLLAVTTYRNSWGQIFHVENLMVLHVLVLGFTPASDSLALRGRAGGIPQDDERYGWPVRLMCLVTVLAYVVAGYAKLDAAGIDWAFGDTLRNQVAYDNLRKDVLGDAHSPLGAWLVGYRWLFPPFALATLAIELGAPVAMAGRASARAWSVAAWGFHAGIFSLMAIVFPYQLLGFAYLPFLRPDLSRPLSRLGMRINPRPQPDPIG